MSAGINIQINQLCLGKLKGSIIGCCLRIIEKQLKNDRSKFFLLMSDDLMRDDSCKLWFGKIEEDVRKTFLMGGQSSSATVKQEKLWKNSSVELPKHGMDKVMAEQIWYWW